jgi:hypothetical protein
MGRNQPILKPQKGFKTFQALCGLILKMVQAKVRQLLLKTFLLP